MLNQFGYKMDTGSESVLKSPLRKLPDEMKKMLLKYLQIYNNSYKKLRVFNPWLKNKAKVQEIMRLEFGSAKDKAKTSFSRDMPKNISLSATSGPVLLVKTRCPLKDEKHRIWHCHAFKKIKLSERHDAVKKRNLCFTCLGSGHKIGQCKANRTCGEDSCSKRRNRLLQSDDSTAKTLKKQNTNNETN